MLHILTVIGARPQIIKAAALSLVIREKFSSRLRETIIHTGQHYDENMSQVFFDELGIPAPKINLQVNSGSREEQISRMAGAIEKIIAQEKPDAILVYGDTNSTKAGAEAGKNSGVPVVHVEAGMRSFNMKMPEELNRIYTDEVSTLLFSPTKTGVENLRKENITKGVYHCGDVMYDNALRFSAIAETKAGMPEKILPGNYFLVTVHRNFNADSPEKLSSILEALEQIANEFHCPVVFPVHPRTKKIIDQFSPAANIILLPPVSFLEMLRLEKNAKLVLTDSGGVQKEAFFFQKPCVILRDETEWTELVDCSAAALAGSGEKKITEAVRDLLHKKINFPEIFGDGNAAEFICSKMIDDLAKR
jgi:UDP-GlcNAc3NAcA epimerase